MPLVRCVSPRLIPCPFPSPSPAAVHGQIRADGRTDPDTYLPLLLARLHFLDREGVRRGGKGQPEKPQEAAAAADGTVAEGESMWDAPNLLFFRC